MEAVGDEWAAVHLNTPPRMAGMREATFYFAEFEQVFPQPLGRVIVGAKMKMDDGGDTRALGRPHADAAYLQKTFKVGGGIPWAWRPQEPWA